MSAGNAAPTNLVTLPVSGVKKTAVTPKQVQAFIDGEVPVFLKCGEGWSATVLLVMQDGERAISKHDTIVHISELTHIGRADGRDDGRRGRR